MSRSRATTFLPKSTAILKGFINHQQLAQQLGRDPRTINRWSERGCGPPTLMPGGTRLYNVSEVRRWLLKQRSTGRKAK